MNSTNSSVESSCLSAFLLDNALTRADIYITSDVLGEGRESGRTGIESSEKSGYATHLCSTISDHFSCSKNSNIVAHLTNFDLYDKPHIFESILLEANSAILLLELGYSTAIQDPRSDTYLKWFAENGFRIFLINDIIEEWREYSPQNESSIMRDSKLSFNCLFIVRSSNFRVIGIFSHSSGIGGGERTLIELCRVLFEKGHLVHVITPDSDGLIHNELEGISIPYTRYPVRWWVQHAGIPVLSPHFDDKLPLLLGLLRNIGADLIISNTMVVSTGFLVAHVLRLPHIWYLHEWCDQSYGFSVPTLNIRETCNIINDSSDIIVVNSLLTAKVFKDLRNPLLVYPISTQHLASCDAPSCHTYTPTIGVIGTIHASKGCKTVIHALGKLHRRGIYAKLVYYGTGDSHYISELLGVAEDEQIPNEIKFEAEKLDPHSIYSAIDIVCMPSLSESFGRVAIESVFNLRPIVYSGSIGASELLENTISGLEFDSSSSSSLENVLARLILDPLLWNRLVTNAVSSIENKVATNDLRRLCNVLHVIRPKSLSSYPSKLLDTLLAQDLEHYQ